MMRTEPAARKGRGSLANGLLGVNHTQSVAATLPQETAQRVTRLPHLDALRGVAVVFIILLHTADGWLRGGLKRRHRLAGDPDGRRAGRPPLFILLAGVGVGLGWASHAERDAYPRRIQLSRGLEIVTPATRCVS